MDRGCEARSIHVLIELPLRVYSVGPYIDGVVYTTTRAVELKNPAELRGILKEDVTLAEQLAV